MNRPVISPTLFSSSSPDHTLEVMQRRIQMAEDETKKLVDQLSDYGFSKEKYEKKDTITGRIDPISPFKPLLPSSLQVEALQKNYEQMVSRVCRAESTIQSLKLAMCSLQAEKELHTLNHEKNISIPRDTFDKEIKTLEKELKRCRKELEEALHERNDLQENLHRISSTLDKTAAFNSDAKVKLEEAKNTREKLTKKVNELKEELSCEKGLRSGLENSHNSLLSRVNDMESLVETEREQVHLLAKECDTLKKESVASKQEYNKEHRLRMQLETLVTQLQEDTSNTDATVATLTAHKKNLESDLSLFKRENKELRQQFETLRTNYEKLKAVHEKISIEHKRASEELRAATVDNRVLVSQQKDAIHRERQAMSAKLAEKDRFVDEAKKTLVKEIEEEKMRLHFVANESRKSNPCKGNKSPTRDSVARKFSRFALAKFSFYGQGEKESGRLVASLCIGLRQMLVNLKDEINKLNEELQAERNKAHLARQEMGLRMAAMEGKLEEVTKQKNTAVKEKSQILDEIEQTVNGFTQERDRIIKQLDKAKKSQHQIDEAMKDMMGAKNKLAYEKGTLQSRVEELQKEVNHVNGLKMDLDQVKRQNSGIQNSYNKVSSELQTCKLDVQTLQGRLLEAHLKCERKDEDLRAVMDSREEALHEVEKLVHHTENMDRNNRQKIGAIQKSFNDARENNIKLSSTMDTLMTSHSELQVTLERMQTELGRRDVELQTTIREKNSAIEIVRHLQNEIEMFQGKVEGLENSEVRELRPLREAFKNAKDDLRDSSQQLDRAMKSNKKLQHTAEHLQKELGRKDVELEKLEKEREQDNKEKHSLVQELQDRLEEISRKTQSEIQDVRNKHKNQSSKLKREVEEAISTCSILREENHQLEHHVKEQEQELDKTKSKIKSLKCQLNHVRKESHVKESEEEAANMKIQNFKTELNRLEKVKAEYVRKNKEQSKTIEEFVSKVTVLQHELKSLIEAHKATAMACKEKDKQLEKERNARIDIEKHLKKAVSHEKELESERQQTEQKLHYANNESDQASESLKEAHKWFRSKFDNLQTELARSKKLQSALERENREQQKKLKEEKKQMDEQTEKAKDVLRASRNAVSKLASEVAENYWETKGMKHAFQAERDYSDMASHKLQQLQ
ncbi:hypothetical protein QZH41_017036, partial [Actinostola sp. cb2023]